MYIGTKYALRAVAHTRTHNTIPYTLRESTTVVHTAYTQEQSHSLSPTLQMGLGNNKNTISTSRQMKF